MVAIANAYTPVGESHNISEHERSELVKLKANTILIRSSPGLSSSTSG
jgi:hypothetical protein